MKHFFAAAAVVFSATLFGVSPRADADQPATYDAAVQLQSLRKVHSSVQEAYWDEDWITGTWDPLLPKYESQLAQADSKDTARQTIQELIKEIGQSHYALIPSSVYKREKELGVGTGNGTLGITLRLVENQFVVTAIAENSPAAAAGIRPGAVITSFGDRTADAVLEKVTVMAEKGVGRLGTKAGLVGESMLRGKVGTEITLEIESHTGESETKKITRVKSPGSFAKFGHLPAIEVITDSRTLPSGVLYFHFSAFFNPLDVLRQFRELIESNPDAPGMVIDVRGNRGGIMMLCMGLSNHLLPTPEDAAETPKEPLLMGRMKSRTMDLKLPLNPNTPAFTRPVVILVDELSISASEVLAGSLQKLGLVTVIGNQSAGMVLPSTVIDLPNGDRFQYAVSDYRTHNGEALEGDGVIPDLIVPMTLAGIRATGDPVLEVADTFLLGKAQKSAK